MSSQRGLKDCKRFVLRLVCIVREIPFLLMKRYSLRFLLMTAVIAAAFGSNAATPKNPARPNILFIIADDASRDSMGVYGSTYVKTPNFDRIASEGVLFTQAYNCNPKCAPARACLLTGRYSWQLEAACNHNPFLPAKWEFYPFLLEDAGYFMGYTGKGWGPVSLVSARATIRPVIRFRVAN